MRVQWHLAVATDAIQNLELQRSKVTRPLWLTKTTFQPSGSVVAQIFVEMPGPAGPGSLVIVPPAARICSAVLYTSCGANKIDICGGTWNHAESCSHASSHGNAWGLGTCFSYVAMMVIYWAHTTHIFSLISSCYNVWIPCCKLVLYDLQPASCKQLQGFQLCQCIPESVGGIRTRT
jgi:hypothetical protein